MKTMTRRQVEAVVAAARDRGERSNLQGVHLSGVDLTGADLRGANLRDANLWAANLTDANLTSADLTGADLTNANLTGASMRYVNLTGANLADDPMTLIDHEIPEVREWAAALITDPTALLQLAMDDAEIVRAAVLANSNCTDEARVAAALQH